MLLCASAACARGGASSPHLAVYLQGLSPQLQGPALRDVKEAAARADGGSALEG